MSNNRLKLETSAKEMVQKSGLNTLSFRTLANSVGIKSSSVHYYFPEKADLAQALIEDYSNEFENQLKTIKQRHSETGKRLDALVDIFEQVLKAEKFCLCGMMAAEVNNLSEANKMSLKHYFQTAEQWITGVLEQDEKQADFTLPPAQLAKTILSGLEGAILLDRVAGNSGRLKAQRELIRILVS